MKMKKKITITLFYFILFLFSIFYSLFSLISLPLFFIIDLILNMKRKDIKFFLFFRYILPFIIIFKKNTNYKNIKNKKTIFFFATSAGEIKTILNLIEKQTKKNINFSKQNNKDFNKDFNNNCDLNFFPIFFYTSITAKEILSKINFDNYNQYLFPDILIFNLFYLLKFKPQKIIFFESEIWPGILIISKILKIKSYYINAKISANLFFNIFYKTFIINLFDFVIPQDKNNFDKFNLFKDINLFQLKTPINYKLNFNFKNYPCLKLKKNLTITFASTHPEDEKIFIHFIKIISKYVEENILFKDLNLLFLIVPRHVERSDSIEIKIKEYFYPKKYRISKLSSYKLFEDILNFQEKLDINDNYNYTNFEDYTNKVLNLNSFNEKFKIVICDKFNILQKIYSLSNITFMGATFFDFGGGHNIIEPLFFKNVLICGPFLYNLKDIFEEVSATFNLCAIFYPNDIFYFIDKKYKKKIQKYSQNVLLINSYNELFNFIIKFIEIDKLIINNNRQNINNINKNFKKLEEYFLIKEKELLNHCLF